MKVEVAVSHLALFKRDALCCCWVGLKAQVPLWSSADSTSPGRVRAPHYYFLCISTDSVAEQGHWPHCCWVGMKVPVSTLPSVTPARTGWGTLLTEWRWITRLLSLCWRAGVGLWFSLWCLAGVRKLSLKSFHLIRLSIPGPVTTKSKLFLGVTLS